MRPSTSRVASRRLGAERVELDVALSDSAMRSILRAHVRLERRRAP